jgi:hypothetical protein
MFSREVPDEEELLDIFRKLSPSMRQSIIKITRDLLEARETAATPPFSPPRSLQIPDP